MVKEPIHLNDRWTFYFFEPIDYSEFFMIRRLLLAARQSVYNSF